MSRVEPTSQKCRRSLQTFPANRNQANCQSGRKLAIKIKLVYFFAETSLAETFRMRRIDQNIPSRLNKKVKVNETTSQLPKWQKIGSLNSTFLKFNNYQRIFLKKW